MRVHRGLQRHTAIEHVWGAGQRVLAVRARPVGRKRAMRLAARSRRGTPRDRRGSLWLRSR
eukprot:4377148-Prymnesium_polylepis.1